jgi:hypothetical protein
MSTLCVYGLCVNFMCELWTLCECLNYEFGLYGLCVNYGLYV